MLPEADLIAKRAALRWLCWLLRISVRKQESKQQREQLHCHLHFGKMEQERNLLAPSAMHFLERISEVASTGIQAQILSAAELAIGMRVAGVTRRDVGTA